jgi:hypothetical protein
MTLPDAIFLLPVVIVALAVLFINNPASQGDDHRGR